MPTLTIDGREVEVAAGTLLIEAVKQIGGEVPHFCYHPALTPVGSCRMCQVTIREGERPPRLTIACRTTVMDGMVVETRSELATEARAGALEFYLSNHPLDCPICDKAGECDLQNYSYRNGYPEGLMREDRRKGVKRTHLGGHIVFDSERCVLCTRCVRFMSDYAKAPQLTVTGRGVRSRIATFPGQPLDSDYTGNLADICPVGALTLEEFRFKSRVWDLTAHPAVCPLCSRGCSIRLDVKRNKLFRVMPRLNDQVNGHFICNRGRFEYLQRAAPQNRLETACIRGEQASRMSTVAEVRRLLGEAGENVLCVLSPRLTNEEIWLLGRILGHERLCALEGAREGGDGILQTGDPNPNTSGLERLGVAILSTEALGKRLAGLKGTALVLLDGEINLGPNVRSTLGSLIVQDVTAGDELRDADVLLPGTTPAEKWGTFINFQNHIQKTTAGLHSPAGISTEFETWLAVGREMQLKDLPAELSAVFAAMRGALGIPSDVTFDAFPPLGLSLEGGNPTAGVLSAGAVNEKEA